MSRTKSTAAKNAPPAPFVGAQISTAGGFSPVPERARTLGAEVVQVFASNPRIWQPRVPTDDELANFTRDLEQYQLPLFFHSIYLINLAAPDEELRHRSVEALSYALALGALCGAAGVVVHMGSHRGDGAARGFSRAASSVRLAIDAARDSVQRRGLASKVPPLLLETGAGAGDGLAGSIEDFVPLLEALPETPAEEGVGLCLDTAHLFAAGYAVHQPEGLDSLLVRLAQLGLLSLVRLVHLNDSASPLGSTRDRHENPGDGQIGYDGLARVVTHPLLSGIPIVLETPGLEGHGPDAANIAMVKAMRAGKNETAARRAARQARARAAAGAARPQTERAATGAARPQAERPQTEPTAQARSVDAARAGRRPRDVEPAATPAEEAATS